MGCSKEDMVYVDEPSDSAYCESIDIEWYGHYDNQTSVPAHVNYHTNDPLGYDVDRAHTDCTLSQPSAFNPGHNSTSRLLLVEQTGSGSAYTTQSLEGPVSQKVEPYRDVEGSHTALVAYTALVSDGGPELRFEEYNDNSQTWQPAKQYEGDCTGLCPSYASVDKPVENIEVDANHHLYASLHEEYSINDCHGYPSPYPAQIEFDSIGMGEQTPTQAMPNQMRNHARRPSLSTLIMERSFPEYMYTPDHKLAERLDTSLSEVHDNSQTSYYDVISPLADTTTPVFFQNPHLGLGEVTSTVCQPAVAQTANISPASQTVPQYTVFPDFYVHTVSRNEIIVDFASNEYGSQSNALSRSSSRRLSVSQEPGSPTPSEISVTPSFVQESLVCSEPRCDTTFTGRYRRGNLARHLRLVHCRRRYPCGVLDCPHYFRRSDARLKHLRIHHPELHVEPASSRK